MARAADPMKKVIKATMKLAAERGWRDITLSDISEASKVSMADLRGLVSGKQDILTQYFERIDAEVLGSIDPEIAQETPRDRIFEVLMRRFELIEPEKDALRKISEDIRSSPGDGLALIGPGVRSMEWMMAGAGTETHGLRGLARAHGLLFVFLSAYRTWLEDDDPGLAPTMATLDRQLRRGENMLNNADLPLNFGRALLQVACNLRKGRASGDGTDTEPEAKPSA